MDFCAKTATDSRTTFKWSDMQKLLRGETFCSSHLKYEGGKDGVLVDHHCAAPCEPLDDLHGSEEVSHKEKYFLHRSIKGEHRVLGF